MARRLRAGAAFRTRGLVTASTPTANAWGYYKVELPSASAEQQGDDADGTLFTGAGEHVVVEIGALGLSAEGDAVADLRREGLVPLVPEDTI